MGERELVVRCRRREGRSRRRRRRGGGAESSAEAGGERAWGAALLPVAGRSHGATRRAAGKRRSKRWWLVARWKPRGRREADRVELCPEGLGQGLSGAGGAAGARRRHAGLSALCTSSAQGEAKGTPPPITEPVINETLLQGRKGMGGRQRFKGALGRAKLPPRPQRRPLRSPDF